MKMAASPPQNHRKDSENRPRTNPKDLLCDYCSDTKALLYCRADSAKLCFSCDRDVHSANALFAKHSRSQLCDSCSSNPATIRCSTENLLLCQNCDWDSHAQSSRHDRRSLDGFSGCPSAFELCSIMGFEDKALFLSCNHGDDGSCDWFKTGMGNAEGDSGFLDAWLWETPSIVSFDDLIVPMVGSAHNLQAVGVPPPPKKWNAACGKNKEEILWQLHNLVKSETDAGNENGELKSDVSLQPQVPECDLLRQHICVDVQQDARLITVPGSETSALQWHGDSVPNKQVPSSYKDSLGSSVAEDTSACGKSFDVHGGGFQTSSGPVEPQHPAVEENASFPAKSVHELINLDRDSAISRYKEKKKTRRYDKHIRYESRKARADNRARIGGRFAKVNQDQTEQATGEHIRGHSEEMTKD